MKKIFTLLIAVFLAVGCFAGCQKNQPSVPSEPEQKHVDYVSEVKLDMKSSTAKQEVTVKTFVDGDTVHFNVPTSVMETGVLKARFLAINTPESTGKIEEYGKAASNFTKEKLSKATSIMIESDTSTWNADSTGGRYLVWVWYKTAESEDYRNLNLEILQNGLAIASNTGAGIYGQTCLAAIAQAEAEKLNIYSGEKDPDFFYGGATELTLKELRCNLEKYKGQKVAFNGVVTMNSKNGVYVEEYDAETNMYYGMYVYYGFNLSGEGLEILTVGNEVRIVGSLQFYEGGGTYQVSDLSYRAMKPDDPNNIQKLSDGHKAAHQLTDAKKFVESKVTIDGQEGPMTFDYAELAMCTSLEMKNLKVVDIYTTDKEDSSSKGAMTLTCEVDGITVYIRTTVLRDADGNLITADAYNGKTIDVKGIVDCFAGKYQIKVFSANDIAVHN